MRIVVAGGGYAGLACLLEMRRRAPSAELHLIDPGEVHVKVTHLHETLHRPLADICVPFAELAERHRFVHHRAALGRGGRFGEAALERWQSERRVRVTEGRGKSRALGFDYLVIATGARSRPLGDGGGARCFDKDALREQDAGKLLQRLSGSAPRGQPQVTVVGAGASGLQFALELAAVARRQSDGPRVRLIDQGSRLLPDLPDGAHEYVIERLGQAQIEYLPGCTFLGQTDSEVSFELDGKSHSSSSALTLLLPGVEPHPRSLNTNRHGQITLDGKVLTRVFAAGDCSRFASTGLNRATAQAALRKGKHVAVNISRRHRGRELLPYLYVELGYLVSLGPLDAVGWVLVRDNVLKGVAAHALKEVIEAQYDLLLEGVDTYLL